MQQNHFVVVTGKKVVAFKLTYRTLFATSSSVEENDQNIGLHINQHTIIPHRENVKSPFGNESEASSNDGSGETSASETEQKCSSRKD